MTPFGQTSVRAITIRHNTDRGPATTAYAVPVPVPLREGRGFVLDADDLRERITSRTHLVLLCNPHNPTGCVHDESSLRDIAQVAIEHDIEIGLERLARSLASLRPQEVSK